MEELKDEEVKEEKAVLTTVNIKNMIPGVELKQMKSSGTGKPIYICTFTDPKSLFYCTADNNLDNSIQISKNGSNQTFMFTLEYPIQTSLQQVFSDIIKLGRGCASIDTIYANESDISQGFTMSRISVRFYLDSTKNIVRF